MKRSVFIFCFLALGLAGHSQCVKTRSVTSKQIAHSFPIKKTKRIIFISFKDVHPVTEEGDSIAPTPFHIPSIHEKFDSSRLVEFAVLDKNLREELAHVFLDYNYDPKNIPVSVSIAMCWDPHNSVLFLDQESKIIASITICFYCSRYEFEPDGKFFGHYCTEKLDLVKSLFVKAGIHLGITKDEHGNPINETR